MTFQGQTDFDEVDRQIAEDARLRYAPPYVDYAPDPEGFYFHWRKLQYAFAFSDPAQFPPISEVLDSKDCEAVKRFVRVCRELATYSLLNHGGGITVTATPDGETVEVDAPAKEALRGFVVLFRQIHSDGNEPASFKVVRSVLSKASAKADDKYVQDRLRVIKQWHGARSQLLQHSLSDIVTVKIQEARVGTPVPPIQREHSPAQLIDLFNYGEYIHWGDNRVKHAALFQDEVGGSLTEFGFQEILIEMSHFYFGYAKLLEAAFGGDINSRMLS
ncbi:hypothetical protein [Arthrobacter sp. Z4-13]